MNQRVLELLAILGSRSIYGFIGALVGFILGFLLLVIFKLYDHPFLVLGLPMLVVGAVSAIAGDRFLGRYIWSCQDRFQRFWRNI